MRGVPRWSRISGRRIRGRRLGVHHPELKYTTSAIADATIDSGGIIVNLWAPTVGAAIDNVVGRTAQIRSIYLRGSLSAVSDGAAAYVAPHVRFMIFADKAVTEETPTVTGAADSTTGVLDTGSILAPLHVNTKGRYQVIADKMFTLNLPAQAVTNTGVAQATTVKRWFQFYKKVNFTAGVAASGEPNRNRIFALVLTDVDEAPAISAQATIRWTDV